MTKKVQPIPTGYHTITPYLIVNDATKAIDFYKKALGAVEMFRMNGPDGKVCHAELKLGDSVVMLADEYPERGAKSPQAFGGSAVTMHVYVEDVDHVYAQAIKAGAKEVRAVENQFYGDRSGGFEDPFGHVWHVATHVEDVAPQEIEERFNKFVKEKNHSCSSC